ncbi:MAG: ABC transporter permease [Rhodospirillaceae bacterium]
MPGPSDVSEALIDNADQVEIQQTTVKPPRRVPTSLVVGGIIVGVFLILAVIGPHITPYPFDKFHFANRLAPPSADFWWGTDRYGRDIFSRVIHGTRLTVLMAGSGTLIGVAFGLLIGLFSGYVGGWIDEILMRITDIAMSFPGLLLAMLVVAALGSNEINALLSIAIVFVPKVARVVRSATLGLRHVQFVEAAQVRGESNAYIIFREILPNVWPPVIVETCIRLSYAVLLVVSLSYLGLGAQPPAPDWGLMIAKERAFLVSGPWVVLAPASAIVLLIIGVNLFGDGMREWVAARKTADE